MRWTAQPTVENDAVIASLAATAEYQRCLLTPSRRRVTRHTDRADSSSDGPHRDRRWAAVSGTHGQGDNGTVLDHSEALVVAHASSTDE
jgi:hypothetical protein